jgi:hypothetical protein
VVAALLEVRGGAILTLATEATSVLSHGNPAWDRWGDGPRIPAMRGARPGSTLAPPLVSSGGDRETS